MTYLFLACLMFGETQAQDLDLFNKSGEPSAYIDTRDEDLTIYLWTGEPLAYLSLTNEGYDIYGFNGNHLGWYEEGVIRDHEGYMVGAIEGATFVITNPSFEFRPQKKFKTFKSFKELAPIKPVYFDVFSNKSLVAFLKQGEQ